MTLLNEDQDTVVTFSELYLLCLSLQDVCPCDGGAGGGDRPFAHCHEGTQVSASDSGPFLQSPACSSQAVCVGQLVFDSVDLWLIHSQAPEVEGGHLCDTHLYHLSSAQSQGTNPHVL